MHDNTGHDDASHRDASHRDADDHTNHHTSHHTNHHTSEEPAPTMSDATDNTPTDPTASPEMVAEITAALEAAMRRAEVIEPQVRMFTRSCADAGFAVSADDLAVDEATGDVTVSLTWRQFLHLTRQFEDVSRAAVSLSPSAPSGPTLFDVDPPAGPVNPRPAGNGLHIEVPA